MLAEAICMEFVGPVKEHKGVMRLVSSAYRIASKCGDAVYMSLMYMIKSSGLRITRVKKSLSMIIWFIDHFAPPDPKELINDHLVIDHFAPPDPKELINNHFVCWWLCIPRPEWVNQWSLGLSMAMHLQTPKS